MLWYFQGLILMPSRFAGHRIVDRAASYTEAVQQWPGVTMALGLPEAVAS